MTRVQTRLSQASPFVPRPASPRGKPAHLTPLSLTPRSELIRKKLIEKARGSLNVIVSGIYQLHAMCWMRRQGAAAMRGAAMLLRNVSMIASTAAASCL